MKNEEKIKLKTEHQAYSLKILNVDSENYLYDIGHLIWVGK